MSAECGVISDPCRALWQMVLYQAVHDAVHGPKNASQFQRARLWKEARDYITTPSEDLATLCDMADVNMQCVVEQVRERIASMVATDITMSGAGT